MQKRTKQEQIVANRTVVYQIKVYEVIAVDETWKALQVSE
jgi:hypothetical protein